MEQIRTIVDEREYDLNRLGDRVRAARTATGMTLAELADNSGVSVSMLSAVERADKAPTITVLARIAHGLVVPLDSLVSAADPARPIVRRADEQDTKIGRGGWKREILSPVVPGVNVELIRTTLPPHCDAGSFPAYAEGSHEFVAVDSGVLTLMVHDEPIRLKAGDSAYFAADTAHGYANHTNRPCRYYIVALIMRSRA